MKRYIVVVFAAAASLVLIVPAGAQKSSEADTLLAAAQQKETLEGDPNAAIKQYSAIVSKFAKTDRAITAMALVHIAECYQKIGDAQARKFYEQVVREYGDQKEAVARARIGLGGHPQESTVRRVWAGGDVDAHSLSADGRLLSYADWETGDLAVRDLQNGESRRLTHIRAVGRSVNDEVDGSSLSPDGRQVAYEWFSAAAKSGEEEDLRVVGTAPQAESSKPRVIYPNNHEFKFVHPVGWLADGQTVVVYGHRRDFSNAILLINSVDGNAKILKDFDWRRSYNIIVSPDGRYIAYDLAPDLDSPQHDIYILTADGTREEKAVEDPADDFLLGWTADGRGLLFGSDRTGSTDLWEVPISAGKPSGRPELIKSDLGRVTPLGTSAKGTFYYAAQGGLRDVYTVSIDPVSFKPVSEPAPVAKRYLGTNDGGAWSPDGKYLAYTSHRGQERNGVICIHSLDTGAERDIMPKLAAIGGGLQWAPDGRSIMGFGRDKNGQMGIYQVDVQNGETALLVEGRLESAWSPDGRTMYFLRDPQNPEEATKIFARNLADGSERELYRLTVGHFGPIAISPDGKYLVFEDNMPNSKGQRILLLPTGGGEPRTLVEAPLIQGYVLLTWAPGTDQVLFAKPGGKGNEIWRVSAQTGEQAFVAEYPGSGTFRAARISPDGRTMAYEFGQTKEEVWALENFLPAPAAKK